MISLTAGGAGKVRKLRYIRKMARVTLYTSDDLLQLWPMVGAPGE